MKTGMAFAIVLYLGFLGYSFAQTWPNNPAGAQTILDFPFSTMESNIWKFAGGAADIINDPTAPGSPSSAVRYTYGQGFTGGVCAAKHWMSLPPVREIFVGYWWKPSNPWQGHSSGVNKVHFLWQANNIVYFSMHGQGSGPFHSIVSLSFTNVSNGHVAGSWGDDPGPRGLYGTNYEIKLGEWHRIEMYVKVSSSLTSRDGIVRWWIDGNLAGNYTTINFAQENFQQFEFSPTWGGTGDVKTQTDYHYFDHAFASLPNGNVSFVSPLVIEGISQSAAPQSGKPYTGTLSASGGKAPYYWAVSAGSLPAGLTVDKMTGKITGTPTTAGRSDFTIKAVDSNAPALVATKSFTLIVSQGTASLISPARESGQDRVGATLVRGFDLLGRELSGTMAGGAKGVCFQVLNHPGKNARRIVKGE